ncbi:hypothetical protein CS063_02440 [Sporanaerobium hydrogeniformans]|uniref:Uncharacterized protein n=1 Tax=Sporanaerobium hydrogeniformans TaxID=3072179 RepID=A0AC61DIJ9_9FIRM|nr:SpoIIIAC/SpoIIIAD family protein [Sporanaerobium hydrogeniformans]PHV72356.1 hypothetical protein CS063_02440 [Sporanaerobium hydrogeniformans]
MFNMSGLDLMVIFKLAGIGLGTTLINQLLKKTDAGEWVFYTTTMGIIFGLLIVLQYVLQFFEAVQTMFTF